MTDRGTLPAVTIAAELPEGLTLGVEEEFQLQDTATGALASRAADVLAAVPAELLTAERVQGELPLSQVESATPVTTTLAEVRRELLGLRSVLVTAARSAGCELAASGTPPLVDLAEHRVRDGDRYADLVDRAGILVDEQVIAGLHVHVGVPDRDRAVLVLDGLRPWLPLLTALGANSPYWRNKDSGFSSYRTAHWGRWPVVGLPPRSGTAAGYDGLVARLLDSGVVPRATNLYWDARLSQRWPTVEVRASDVTLAVEESVLVAGLVRALARHLLADHDAGRVPPDPGDVVLSAARWNAGRDGLAALVWDVDVGGWRRAAEVVADLPARLAPALEETGDRAEVATLVTRLLAGGTGADRQRSAFAEGGLRAVAAHVARETAHGTEAAP